MMTKSRFLSLALIAGTFFTSLPVDDALARPAGAYSYRSSSSPSYSSRSYSAPVRSSSGYGGSSRASSSSSSSYRMSSSDRSSLGTASRSSYDDYRRSQTPVASAPPTPPVRSYAPPSYSQPSYPRSSYAQTAPAPAPVAPQREGMSPLTAGVIGAMAGHILSEHSNDRHDYSAPAAPGQVNFGEGYQGQAPSPYGASSPTQAAPASVNHATSHAATATGSHGFGLVLFLVLLVLLILGVVMFFLFRNKSLTSKPSYNEGKWGEGDTAKSSKDADFGLHIGGGVTIPLLETSSPASSAMEPLHFEPDARGSRSIVSVMKSTDTREMELNLDKDGNDFIRIDADGGTKFFSILDEVFPANRDEWGEWLDEENGILGLPTFITPKRSLNGREWPETQWSRCLLSQHDDRLAPQRMLFQLADGSSKGTTQIEMLETVYFRETGYAKGYPQIEYLMVRVKNVTGSQRTTSITIHAGTDVTKSSLGLSTGI